MHFIMLNIAFIQQSHFKPLEVNFVHLHTIYKRWSSGRENTAISEHNTKQLSHFTTVKHGMYMQVIKLYTCTIVYRLLIEIMKYQLLEACETRHSKVVWSRLITSVGWDGSIFRGHPKLSTLSHTNKTLVGAGVTW